MNSNSHRPTAIVVTTIFEPEFLAGYLGSIANANRRDDVTIYVIIDRKTPASVAAAAAEARSKGFRVVCPSLDEQDTFLNQVGIPTDFIPYNTDNRRNIGFLMALEAGCEVLISIDDDNFTSPDQDFVGAHHVVGHPIQADVVHSSDNWFNICQLLKTDVAAEIYPRGFPYYAQRKRAIEIGASSQPITIAINAGLWLDEPDVDAVFRLCQRPKVINAQRSQVVLDTKTWSPINTQNTALTREAALTYYYVRMGFPLRGLSIDRFGDILSGYLTQKCMKHLGYGARLGTPVVDHRRTPHNLFKDLYHELAGIVLVEELLPWLLEVKLQGSTALRAYESLAAELTAAASQFSGFIWDDGGRDFLLATAANMRTWINCVKRWAH